jgi:hypothetical protein
MKANGCQEKRSGIWLMWERIRKKVGLIGFVSSIGFIGWIVYLFFWHGFHGFFLFFGTPVKSAIARNYRSFNRAGGLHGLHGCFFMQRDPGLRLRLWLCRDRSESPLRNGSFGKLAAKRTGELRIT